MDDDLGVVFKKTVENFKSFWNVFLLKTSDDAFKSF